MGRTVVSVYAVDETGATGQYLGAGLLLEVRGVIVYPPLDDALRGAPRRLRVGLGSPETTYTEIIDVAAVHEVETAPDLVGLELARPSTLPTEVIARDAGPDQMADIVRAILAGAAPDRPPSGTVDPGPIPVRSLLCFVCPGCC